MKSSFVEVHDREGTSSESGKKINFDFAEKVVSLALEQLVRLLLDHNDDISRFDSRCLIRLSVESDRLALLHSSVDVNLEYLSLVDNLLSVAVLASILRVDDFSLSVTIVARLLDLLNHGTELTKNDLDSLTFTRSTSLDRAFLSTFPFALSTEDVFL